MNALERIGEIESNTLPPPRCVTCDKELTEAWCAPNHTVAHASRLGGISVTTADAEKRFLLRAFKVMRGIAVRHTEVIDRAYNRVPKMEEMTVDAEFERAMKTQDEPRSKT